MSTHAITGLNALEILDSRGRPTVKVTIGLDDGSTSSASVPSGASRGRFEAHELRDGDTARHRGLGCLHAVANVRGDIATRVCETERFDQERLDVTMRELDGTDNLSRLGANAVLAVSLAFARACAHAREVPLWRHVADLAGTEPSMPLPMINLFSGGKHAGGQVDIQDVQVMPTSQTTVDGVLTAAAEIFATAASLVGDRYGVRMLRADEGGLAPPFANSDEMIECACEAVAVAGFSAHDVALTVDVAASHFFVDGIYHLDGDELDAAGMAARVEGWVAHFPVVSIEDGLAEEDWDGWPHMAARLHGRAMTLGDDLLCTNLSRIGRAAEARAADALLLKANQVGTVTEALAAHTEARSASWRVVVSARSGETEDDWLADLAVGLGADHIKVGAITQSERLAKYNRLLEIDRSAGLGTLRPFKLEDSR